jgi:hypothetical protein
VDANGRLSATCRKDNGQYTRTTLIAKKCPSHRAGNSNGRLVCESQSNGNYGRWDGSFRSSCRDASTNSAGMLTATCQTANGNWQRTSLSVRDCTSYRAGNSNGRLVCESDGNYGRWEGSFRNSCRDASTDSSGMLTATCQTANGNWQRTSLSVRDCSSLRAGNRDGHLFCESQSGAGYGRGEGSFSRSCRDASMDSAGTLTTTCQTMNGN